MQMDANSGVKKQTMEAKILNADGTVKEDLGVVSFWHENAFRRFTWSVRMKVVFWYRHWYARCSK